MTLAFDDGRERFQKPETPGTAPQSRELKEALDSLTGVKFDRNSVHEFFGSEQSSREAISLAIETAMKEQNLSAIDLEERSGVSIDVISLILNCEYSLSDSKVITDIEQALRVPLRHL